MTLAALAVLVLVLVAVHGSWTARRLDRLHKRVDAALAALDAALVRRAAAARAVAVLLRPLPQAAALEATARAALEAGDGEREAAENALSGALRLAVPLLPPDADLTELSAATTRVGLARSFHDAAVRDTRALRRRRHTRVLRLAGHRAVPRYLDIDDTSIPR